ncbi:ankyrin repeat domain-containing protein [Endozoicomonas sp. YOMI1]|uniref:ankyrin repeat domain-containing protein n=1 Tax=Endozoicomonas sp. YOMI1 TaxID=2828739 RepID=UPI0021471FA1|nr:ankyrin repeat domain-containing protein [Endozoicomonas sp. YOMI1]
MYPAINCKVDSVPDSASGLNIELNQPDQLGNFYSRTSSCAAGSSPGNNPSVGGKQPFFDYPEAVTLADRTMAEYRNMPSRFASAMPVTTGLATADYSGCATGGRDKAETVNDSSVCSRSSDGSKLREQLKRLLDHSLLQSYVETNPGFLQKLKLDGLVKKALHDFFKNSTYHFPPVISVNDQVQAEQLLNWFAQSEPGRRLYRKAVANNLVAVERLLRGAGVDINHQSTKSGNTPIMAAALANHWTMVSLLLDANASVDKQDESGLHLLDLIFCARRNYRITGEQQHTLTLKALQNQPDAQIKVAQGSTTKLLSLHAFQHAVKRNCFLLCNALLQENAPLVSALKQYQTGSQLIMNVVSDYRDLATATTYLLNLKDSKGQRLFNLNCKTQYGETLLILAAQKGNTNTMRALLKAPGGGQNINDSVVTKGLSPIRWTAYTYAHYYSKRYKNGFILKELRMYGAEPKPASYVLKRPDSDYGYSGSFGSFGSYGGGGGSDCCMDSGGGF